MSREERIESMRNLTEELKELEGVSDVVLDDFSPNTAQSGQIYLEVEGEKRFRSVYSLDPSLRSLAQRIRYKLKESGLFNFMVYEKPSKVYDVHGDPVGYDSKGYMIDVTP